MPGSIEETPFSDVDLNDDFFDSLKQDYDGTPNFADWFAESGEPRASRYRSVSLGRAACG